MTIVVRFSQRETYDINRDADVVLFMATTDKGSYYADFVNDGARSIRMNREKFKALAVQAIERGENPRKLELDDE